MANTSSCVIPRTLSAPLRSTSRKSSSPMTSHRPDRFHTSPGWRAGRWNCWPPIRFISSRMIRKTLS